MAKRKSALQKIGDARMRLRETAVAYVTATTLPGAAAVIKAGDEHERAALAFAWAVNGATANDRQGAGFAHLNEDFSK